MAEAHNHHNHSTFPASLPPLSSQRLPVTVDSFKDIRIPADAHLSPDGQHVAFVLFTCVGDEPKPRQRLWIVDMSGGDPYPFTQGEYEESCPHWSPDSKLLAFLSKQSGQDQEAKPQLYVRALDDKPARRVCTMPNGMSDLSWSPDGKRIAFISLEGNVPQKDPLVLAPARSHRLWTVHLESDTAQPVTTDGVSVWEYKWSPDGQGFALYYSTGPDDTDWYRGQIGIVSANGGAIRQISKLTRQASSLAWSPDGKHIAYISGEWSDPAQGGGDIYVCDYDSNTVRNLTPGISCSPGWCAWFPDGRRLLYAAWYGVTYQIGIVDSQDGTITTIENDFVIEAYLTRLAPTPDLRRFVTIHSAPQNPPDIWLGEIVEEKNANTSVAWRQLSRFNSLIEETLALAPSRRIRYISVDGWEVDAIFTPPLKRKGDTSPSLYVEVHGGPSGARLDGWTSLVQILAAAGYAVLQPNMRGSWGRGVAYADAVLGDMGGKDFQDILHGVGYLIEQGLVDGARVGIGGWSNGGFLTAWAVTQTTRFKAAMVGAGITDWHNMHAQTNIADADMRLLKANPLENPELYHQNSPITYAARVTTPTLILHGEDDPAVPVAQAYAFYHALRERQVPVECVIYPREGHGLSERAHVRDYYERLVRWLDRYM